MKIEICKDPAITTDMINPSRELRTFNELVERSMVSDQEVSWQVESPRYKPQFQSPVRCVEATDEQFDSNFADLWAIPDRSQCGLDIAQDECGRPLFPLGRTGVAGRGVLWRFGANQAADAVVTRRNADGELELLTIIDKEGDVALPGGFIDPGEDAAFAAKREAREETGIVVPEDLTGQQVVRGLLLTSSRTTDHAWIETTAHHFHLEGEAALQLPEQNPDLIDDALAANYLSLPECLHGFKDIHRQIVERALSATGAAVGK